MRLLYTNYLTPKPNQTKPVYLLALLKRTGCSPQGLRSSKTQPICKNNKQSIMLKSLSWAWALKHTCSPGPAHATIEPKTQARIQPKSSPMQEPQRTHTRGLRVFFPPFLFFLVFLYLRQGLTKFPLLENPKLS